MRNCALLVLLALCAISGFAQQSKVVISFADAEKMTSLSNITLVNGKGEIVAKTDSLGRAVLPLDALSGTPLIAICPGYKTDTVSAITGTIYLRPLTVNLEETVITNRKVERLSPFNNEYLVDYEFAGDKILVATYSGNNGSRAKLFLLDGAGTILAACKIPGEPRSLFRSCIGNYYYVADSHFYPIIISGKSLSVANPYPVKLLPGLQQCEQAINGNLYYRLGDNTGFNVTYGMIAKDDSVFKTFETFEENDVARASFMELLEIIELWNTGQSREAARRKLAREKWDRGSFAHINMPLFAHGDSLLVFDFFKKRIKYFLLSGASAGYCPISFAWKQSQQFEILNDRVSNRFYIHRYDNKERQTLEELDIKTGVTYNKFVLEKPLAEQVKVHDGLVYFLWQLPAKPRQLYCQKIAAPEALSVSQ